MGLSLRRRQILERMRVAQLELEAVQMDCRAVRHAIRQVTNITTFSSKLSACSLHQIKRVHGSGSPSVAALAWVDMSLINGDDRGPMTVLSVIISGAYVQR
jgi:hypothetical protein